MSDLLNAKELAAELEIAESTFHKHRATYAPMFRVTRPVGQKRYSRELVRRYKFGLSMALIGKGSRQT